jgi:hypothetical protein
MAVTRAASRLSAPLERGTALSRPAWYGIGRNQMQAVNNAKAL